MAERQLTVLSAAGQTLAFPTVEEEKNTFTPARQRYKLNAEKLENSIPVKNCQAILSLLLRSLCHEVASRSEAVGGEPSRSQVERGGPITKRHVGATWRCVIGRPPPPRR